MISILTVFPPNGMGPSPDAPVDAATLPPSDAAGFSSLLAGRIASAAPAQPPNLGGQAASPSTPAQANPPEPIEISGDIALAGLPAPTQALLPLGDTVTEPEAPAEKDSAGAEEIPLDPLAAATLMTQIASAGLISAQPAQAASAPPPQVAPPAPSRWTDQTTAMPVEQQATIESAVTTQEGASSATFRMPPEGLEEQALPSASPATERQALPGAITLEEEFTPASDATAPHAAQHPDMPSPPAFEAPPLRPPEAYTRPAPAATQVSIEAPLQSPEFQTEFSDKVIWMAGRREQWAELSLNPANLGTVEIRLALRESGAEAQFFSPHPQVREALEAAIPRLREMLAQSGISLQDTSVRDQALPQRDSAGNWEGRSGGQGAGRIVEEDIPALGVSALRARPLTGLVDYYA